MLPRAAYTGPAVFAWEQRHFFGGGWLCVGRSDQIPSPGDQRADFWDITNRQDWHACESVQRGLSSVHARPGPLSREEDAVYQFVTMVARGYTGQPVWNPGQARV
jgi:phenylpropionate dioxygenase-like ring-hydroxylating dioxygenase large terminal subunit